MRKYLYLLSVSLIAATTGRAEAITAAQQLREVKAIFVADFHKMDDNKDGKLSLEEYLNHQFENFRTTIIDATDFDTPSSQPKATSVDKDKPATPETLVAEKDKEGKGETDELKSLSDVNNTLLEMANFELEDDDDLPPIEDLSLEGFVADTDGNTDKSEPSAGTAPQPDTINDMDDPEDLSLNADVLLSTSETDVLTMDDKPATAEETVLDEAFLNLDLSVSEEENFQKMMAKINMTPEEKAAREQAAKEAEAATAAMATPSARTPEEKATREKQITFMLDTIKRTLPKPVDDITTWTDVEYKDNVISYVYKAGIDVADFSATEKTTLQNRIKNEACSKARLEMCPKIKPMFIDEGVNMRIRYVDKRGTELSSCEFNQETCQ